MDQGKALSVAKQSGPAAEAQPAPRSFYRHTRIVRIAHWINALSFLMLLMSGLQIFNAHPAIYWGPFGADADKPWFEIQSLQYADGHLQGVTKLGEAKIDTTGFLGVSKLNGQPNTVAFPAWMTVPSWRDLATGRRWHFFFAWCLVINGFTYLVFGFVNHHFQRDIALKKGELAPKHLWREIVDHALLKHPTGAAATRYNTLQKIAYLAVIFLLFPLMILTGLTMSPSFDAIAPFLLDLFGGRQSARSIHFICANLLMLFLIIHLLEVVIAGAWNEIRSMITGRYVVPEPHEKDQTKPEVAS